MMEIVPYKAEHLMAIALQEAQQFLAKNVTFTHAKSLEQTTAFTAMHDGKPLGCGGVIDHWPGRAEAWSYLSGDVTPRTFVQIHHAVKRFFDAHDAARMEAYVDCNFPAGHRWVKALGFEIENPRMRKYWPDGRDAALYVRIR